MGPALCKGLHVALTEQQALLDVTTLLRAPSLEPNLVDFLPTGMPYFCGIALRRTLLDVTILLQARLKTRIFSRTECQCKGHGWMLLKVHLKQSELGQSLERAHEPCPQGTGGIAQGQQACICRRQNAVQGTLHSAESVPEACT